jgi:DNA-binding NarL/FixJ family response regulator
MGAFSDTSDRAVPTIIIESHRLLRDGLASLISNFSYRIVDSFSSVSEVGGLPEVAGPRQLVLMGLQKLDAAENAAAHIRKIWPNCKIVLLLDYLSPADYQNLLTSDIDGCVPLYASRHVLISILDLVVFNDVRIIVMAGTDRRKNAEDASRNDLNTAGHCGIDEAGCRDRTEASTPYLITQAQLSDMAPFQASDPHIARHIASDPHTTSDRHIASDRHITSDRHVASDPHITSDRHVASDPHITGDRHVASDPHLMPVTENGDREAEVNDISHPNGLNVRPPRNCPRLSNREWQILSGLVKGHANKVIARDCNITEATVKVHMKSILRKIRVDNRTQAAVWALENGSTPQELAERLSSAVAEL